MTTFSDAAVATGHDLQVLPIRVTRHERILVVEDDRSMRDSLARRLRRNGYDVRTAPDGRSGLDTASIEEIDVIILDLWMPRMHGIKLLHELRGTDEPVPVIVMTGDLDPLLVRDATALGAVEVLHKPFAFEALIQSIEAVTQFGPSLL